MAIQFPRRGGPPSARLFGSSVRLWQGVIKSTWKIQQPAGEKLKRGRQVNNSPVAYSQSGVLAHRNHAIRVVRRAPKSRQNWGDVDRRCSWAALFSHIQRLPEDRICNCTRLVELKVVFIMRYMGTSMQMVYTGAARLQTAPKIIFILAWKVF